MSNQNPGNGTKDISEILNDVEKRVQENRSKFDDTGKTVKDFRRVFDQDSSRMNQTIFNDAPQEEVYLETLRTVSILVEILTRAKKK